MTGEFKNLKLKSMEELQSSGMKIKCNKLFGQRGTWNFNRRILSPKSKSKVK